MPCLGFFDTSGEESFLSVLIKAFLVNRESSESRKESKLVPES